MYYLRWCGIMIKKLVQLFKEIRSNSNMPIHADNENAHDANNCIITNFEDFILSDDINSNNYECPYFSKMHVEVTSLCNLKCSHCSRTLADYPSKNKVMSADLFRNIVDKVASRIDLLHVQGFGEPTMHPQFADLLKYAVDSKKFNAVSTTTNLLYKTPDDYSSYFDKGLASLIISVDSIDPINIAQIRQGSDLQLLLNNIKIIAAKHANKLALQTTVNRINVSELDKIALFIIDNGIPNWTLNCEQYVDGKGDNRIEFAKYGNQSLFINDLASLSAMVKSKYGNNINIDTTLLYQHPIDRPRCMMTWEWLHINSVGIVVPCCRYMDDNYTKLGDVNLMDINDIWKSPQMQEFRNNMYDIQPEICRYCRHY